MNRRDLFRLLALAPFAAAAKVKAKSLVTEETAGWEIGQGVYSFGNTLTRSTLITEDPIDYTGFFRSLGRRE